MFMSVLIFLGSKSDLEITGRGLDALKQLNISHELRICSAHRTPAQLEEHIEKFHAENGQVFICVAGKSAHLAGVVAAQTLKPVLAVPVYGKATSGMDALLSMGQMPGGIPVGTLGIGASGFENACLLAAQILGLADPKVFENLQSHRTQMAKKVMQDDQEHLVQFSAK